MFSALRDLLHAVRGGGARCSLSDGSATETASRLEARASWGVFYSAGSAINACDFLKRLIQSFTRAELRALLHVVGTASRPSFVRIECRYVADACDHLVKSGQVLPSWPESDLWLGIQQIVTQMPPDYIQVRWMAAHLDEALRGSVRQKAMDSGLVTQSDMEGNVGADALANEGQVRRPLSPDIRRALKDRAYITKMVQTCMVAV